MQKTDFLLTRFIYLLIYVLFMYYLANFVLSTLALTDEAIFIVTRNLGSMFYSFSLNEYILFRKKEISMLNQL